MDNERKKPATEILKHDYSKRSRDEDQNQQYQESVRTDRDDRDNTNYGRTPPKRGKSPQPSRDSRDPRIKTTSKRERTPLRSEPHQRTPQRRDVDTREFRDKTSNRRKRTPLRSESHQRTPQRRDVDIRESRDKTSNRGERTPMRLVSQQRSSQEGKLHNIIIQRVNLSRIRKQSEKLLEVFDIVSTLLITPTQNDTAVSVSKQW